jgi:hypothetical protein
LGFGAFFLVGVFSNSANFVSINSSACFAGKLTTSPAWYANLYLPTGLFKNLIFLFAIFGVFGYLKEKPRPGLDLSAAGGFHNELKTNYAVNASNIAANDTARRAPVSACRCAVILTRALISWTYGLTIISTPPH